VGAAPRGHSAAVHMLPAPAQSDTTTGTRQGTAVRDEGRWGAELLDLLSDASNAANAGVVAADMAAHNMAVIHQETSDWESAAALAVDSIAPSSGWGSVAAAAVGASSTPSSGWGSVAAAAVGASSTPSPGWDSAVAKQVLAGSVELDVEVTDALDLEDIVYTLDRVVCKVAVDEARRIWFEIDRGTHYHYGGAVSTQSQVLWNDDNNLAWELYEEAQWADELHQDRMDARLRPRLSRMEWLAQRELTGRFMW
jgi:hypothetical protein